MQEGNSDGLMFDTKLYTALKAAEMRYVWIARQIEFVDERIASAKRGRAEVATGFQWGSDEERRHYNGLLQQRKALRGKLESLVMSVPV